MTYRVGMKCFLIILLLTCLQSISRAEEWKGIVPGVATRSDVARLFGMCADRTHPCEFNVDGDQIRIVFSGMVQDYFYQCATRIPPETVLAVEVTPRSALTLKQFRRSHKL